MRSTLIDTSIGLLQIIGVAVAASLLLVVIPRAMWSLVLNSESRFYRRLNKARKRAGEFNSAMKELMDDGKESYMHLRVRISEDAWLKIEYRYLFQSSVELVLECLLPAEPSFVKTVHTMMLDEADFMSADSSPQDVAERFARSIRIYSDMSYEMVAEIMESAIERKESFQGMYYPVFYRPEQVREERQALGLA